MKILIVSKEGDCESAIVEGLLKKKLNCLEEHDIFIESVFTSDVNIEDHPSLMALEISNHWDIDISNIKGRQFRNRDFIDFDEIYTMDTQNFSHLMKIAPSEDLFLKVFPISYYSDPDEHSIIDIVDVNEDEFSTIGQSLDDITDRMLSSFIKKEQTLSINNQDPKSVVNFY